LHTRGLLCNIRACLTHKVLQVRTER